MIVVLPSDTITVLPQYQSKRNYSSTNICLPKKKKKTCTNSHTLSVVVLSWSTLLNHLIPTHSVHLPASKQNQKLFYRKLKLQKPLDENMQECKHLHSFTKYIIIIQIKQHDARPMCWLSFSCWPSGWGTAETLCPFHRYPKKHTHKHAQTHTRDTNAIYGRNQRVCSSVLRQERWGYHLYLHAGGGRNKIIPQQQGPAMRFAGQL